MDRTRDRVRGFVHRCARGGRVVYALGARTRIHALCDLPNRVGNRVDYPANAPFHLIRTDGTD